MVKAEKKEGNAFKNKLQEEIINAYKHKRLIVGIITIIILVAIYLFKDSNSITLRYSTFLGVMILFYLIDHFFFIRFEFKHYIFVILIAVSTILMSHLYFVHPQYDKVQHFIIPIFVCSIVFFMVSRLKLQLKWKIIFTVLSVLALLTTFEMLEYVLDLFFNWKLQGVYLRDLSGLEKFNLLLDPLDDTMADLAFGTLGCSVYALYAWLRYNKMKSKGI